MNIVVVGCGVSGLSSAIRLLEAFSREAGNSVTIWAHRLPPDTTSNAAPAIWYPYASSGPDAPAWGERTFQELLSLQERGTPGIAALEGVELFRSPLVEDPWWSRTLPGVRREKPSGFPSDYATALRFTTLLVEMDVYLPYLMERFTALGGQILRLEDEIGSLSEPLGFADAVINCSGVYARRLTPEEDVFPLRGQIIRIEPLQLERFVMDLEDEENPTYVIPRSHDCVLGGTSWPQRWNLEPDDEVTEQIFERCARLVPEVTKSEVLGVSVGLRPARSTGVRLEGEHREGKLVVHNYGHGGAGVTLSWGCAERVVEIVRENR